MNKFNKFDDKELFCKIVLESESINEILRKYNLKETVTHYRNKIKEYCLKYNIEVPKYDFTLAGHKLKYLNTRSFDDIFKKDTLCSQHCLRSRVIKEKLLEYVCSICKIIPEWNNKPLTLQLDHINGIRNDNRLENLRWLCPNCHTQTETYSNKKIKIKKEYPKNRKPPSTKGQPNPEQRKVIWPTKEELEKLVWEKPTVSIAKDFGVSDKAIEKWCKKYEIEKPQRGYWAKQKSIN